ncbi:hypothetical protein ACFC36_33690, partial [Streptomyces rubiginosohelvolus]
YQARLQARFGRNWRRKAPIESMMPLRLAKYGVPLAETAPAGLAAAGIEEPILATVRREGAVGEPPELATGHQLAAVEQGDLSERPVETVHAGPANGPSGQEPPPSWPEPVLPEVDYLAAAEGYVAQHGRFPDAEQFGLFLAQYGITDPRTRGSLPGPLLDPVLDHLWAAHHERLIPGGQRSASGDGSPTASEPEDPGPAPRPDADEVPGPRAGTSAWFDAGPKEPADDTGPHRLEDLESWNGASGDTALNHDPSHSSSEPVAAAASSGATADRSGTRRLVVDVRIPDDELPHQASPSDRDEEQPAQDEAPQDSSPPTGAEVVAARYRELSVEERSRSANSLAPQIAEGTAYTVGTVRKYLGDIKRAEREGGQAG